MTRCDFGGIGWRVLGRVLGVGAGLGVGVGMVWGDYPGTVIAHGPVAYWRLNEGGVIPAGDRALNQGSLEGAVDGFYQGNALHPVKGGLAGSSDTAAAFDGSPGTLVRIPQQAGLQGAGPFTVEFWTKPNTTRPDDDAVMCPLASVRREAPDASGWLFYQAASGWNFRLGNRSGYVVDLWGTNSPVIGRWYHVAGVFDGVRARLYVNGREEGSGAPSGGYEPNRSMPMGLGGRGDGNFLYSGVMDEVAIYGVALGPEEVRAHYENGTSSFPARPYHQLVLEREPLAYFRLNEPPYSSSGSLPVAWNWGTRGNVLNGRWYPGLVADGWGPRPPAYAGFESANTAGGFNGAGGYVGTPYQLNQRSRFSLLGWVKRGALGSGRGGFWGQHDLVEIGEADGGLVVEARIAAYDASLKVPCPFGTNDWGFLALVADGTKAVLYTNGFPAASLAGNVITYGSSGYAFNVGGGGIWRTEGDYFQGGLDEVAVFERALSEAEVRTIFYAANLPPRITASPVGPEGGVFAGNPVLLTVGAMGTPPLGYQWRMEGQTLVGQTASNLFFPSIQGIDSGGYDVVVWNAYGAVTSGVVELEVEGASAPILLRQPESRVRFVGSGVRFEVEATGSLPLAYQWQTGAGVNLAGETNRFLELKSLRAEDGGTYRVVVRNAVDPVGARSEGAVLTVLEPAGYTAEVLTDGPLAYWRLGEKAGTVASDAWMGRDGVFERVELGLAGFAATEADTAAGFSPARDALMRVTASGVFNFQGLIPSFTLEAWVMWGDLSGVQQLISTRQTPLTLTGGYALGAVDGEKLRLTLFGLQDIDTPVLHPPLVAGRWYHVVAVVEGGMTTLYLNGEKVGGPVAFAAPLAGSDQPLQLGRNPQVGLGEEELNGRLDEVAVYGKALSAARVARHFQARYGMEAAPVFTQPPISTTVYTARAAYFQAVAEGTEPIRYQWTINGVGVSGATNLSFEPVLTPGSYGVGCVAINRAGAATSVPAALTVLPLPTASDLRSNLVLHLKFDGDYVDTSGRRNMARPVGSPGWVAGRIGSAALSYETEVGGATKVYRYVSLGNPPDLQFGRDTAFTVACWVRFKGTPGGLPFLANNDGGLGDTGFTLAPSDGRGGWAWSLNDTVRPRPWPGIGVEAEVEGAINDDAWHHLAFTFDRAGMGVTYVDGVKVAERSLAPAVGWDLNTGQEVNVGQAGGTYPVSGRFALDDLGIWRRALSALEVDTMYLVGWLYGHSFAPDVATLGIERLGTLVRVVWVGVAILEQAEAPQGPWVAIPNAASPYAVEPVGKARFYRLRVSGG